ncbi:Transposase (plasmid) [Roseomonas mucosa]|nr:Transposase [Roseomonas mucosa]
MRLAIGRWFSRWTRGTRSEPSTAPQSELSLILAPPAEKANAKVHPFHPRQGIHILGGAVSPPSGGFDADGFFRKSPWMVGNGASCWPPYRRGHNQVE